MKRFSYIALISIYILSGMAHLVSGGEISFLRLNSVSSKSSVPSQTIIFSSKIPKHIIPSLQTNVEVPLFFVTGSDPLYKKYVATLFDETVCKISKPSLTKPANKAPPESQFLSSI